MSPRLQLFPITRGDCAQVPRPCPYTSCRYHLAEFKRHAEAESCALDVADRGEHDLKEIGAVMGITHQAVQQIEVQALRKMAHRARHVR